MWYIMYRETMLYVFYKITRDGRGGEAGRRVAMTIVLYGLVWVSYWLTFRKWSNGLIPQ